ncbi:Uncharacterised protein [uncultured archaeon]|nr:Uncharacterised protein [uncultured archaeon]
MNFLISFSQTALSAGTWQCSFDDGTVSSGNTTYRITGKIPVVSSITIETSVSTTLYIKGDVDSVVYLPAGKYLRIKATIEDMKIVSTGTFDLWFSASTELHSPEVS